MACKRPLCERDGNPQDPDGYCAGCRFDVDNPPKHNSRTNLWIERDLSSGRFVEDKERKVRGGSFKGVRRER